jgi:hypothetical protein
MYKQPEPQEVTLVLDRPEMSPDAWARNLQWLLIKEAMRRQPQPRRTLTISFGDQPDFFIVEEFGKG